LGPLDIGGENVTAHRSKKLAATRDLRVILIVLISIATPASSQNTGIDPDHQKTATPD
jgi:hypothetical protein